MFEYDPDKPDKSAANFAKHGVNFEAGQELWQDERGIEGDTGFLSEARRIRIGKIAGKLWAAVFTERGDQIRIISVRRARRIEAKAYETQES